MQPAFKGSNSTSTSIQVYWIALTSHLDTGNTEILDYDLWWDANSAITNIKLFEDLTLNYTV